MYIKEMVGGGDFPQNEKNPKLKYQVHIYTSQGTIQPSFRII